MLRHGRMARTMSDHTRQAGPTAGPPAGPTGGPTTGPAAWWRAFRRMPDSVRVSTYVVAGLVLSLVVAGLFALALARRPLPQTGGELEVPGVAGTVTVLRDGAGVPQVYADSVTDLAIAQGYVTAQERFFQMDVRRRSASGTLAELVGGGALPGDRVARTLGFRVVAQQEVALLSPDTRAFLEAYADGVNAYLAQQEPSELAVEYTLLDLDGADSAPEDWTAVDSLTWLKAYGWDLGGGAADEVERVLVADAVGSQRAEQLWPAYSHQTVTPVVTGGAVVDGRFEPGATEGGTRNPQRVGFGPRRVRAVGAAGRALDALPEGVGRGPGVGSNAVVVGAEASATGAPLLAVDPHLAAQVPGPFMQVGLHCRDVGPECPWDVAGFSLPGVPGVVQGHNAEVAWGMAAAGLDTTDLVVERIRDGRVLTDRRTRPVRTRTETIDVAGAGSELLTVRTTRHGPILSDIDPAAREAGEAAPAARGADLDEELAIAVQWAGSTPAPTLDALVDLALAEDVATARQALSSWAVPAVDVVLADREGTVGVQVAGAVPVRKSGRDTTEPTAGWRAENEWTGRTLAYGALPFTTQPADGVAVAANQAPVGTDYPFHLGTTWDPGSRASRLRDLVVSEPQDVGSLQEAQRDSLSPLAPVLVPALLAVGLDDGYADDGQRLLEDWDLTQPAAGSGAAAAAYLNATWRELLALTFHDELPAQVWPDGGPRWVEVVAGLLDSPQDPWWDDVTTDRVEDRDDVLRRAMLEARDELTRRQAREAEQWTWGHVHRLFLTSPGLVGDGVALDLARRVVEPDAWEVGGGPGAVDATGWDASRGFEVTTTPAMRMVLSLEDWDDSRWVSLTGVSGHPTSSHYTDQTDLLVAGGTLPFLFSPEAVADAADSELTLRPAP